MRIGNKDFDVENHAYVMGILNVTPDSFSDSEKWNNLDAALKHTEEMLATARISSTLVASTRPGYGAILPDADEIARVLPVIEAVKARFDV
ncbi:MAG: dihydropteroate synthase [Lachnospiraceae bacterium]